MPIHRGYIYWVDFGNPEPDGHEMGFMHPAVVLSLDVINNSKGNFLITVIPGTTKGRLASTHPFLHVVSVKPDPENRLREETFFLGHQIRSKGVST